MPIIFYPVNQENDVWKCFRLIFNPVDHPGASSRAQIAFFLGSKAEAPACGCFEGTSISLRVPGDAKMVLEWPIKLKSRVINQERMFDNVFD